MSLFLRRIGMSNVDELWPIKIVQESFLCESTRKARNSCSTSSRDTVCTGLFSLNNCLFPLIFLTESLLTRVAPGLILFFGKMYLEKIVRLVSLIADS